MEKPKFIASCSFGKDSLAAILLAKEHGEPLDEAVYCEVMFDEGVSGEVPEHRDFIYNTAIPALERMGIKVVVLRSDKTYVGLFTGRVTRGPKKGMVRSFPICGKCAVQRDCKVRPEFITMGIAEHYSALRLTVLNRKEGVVDKSVLRFEDILGKKAVPGNPNFRDGVSPYIWDDRGKADWYVYRPTPADFEALRQAADDCLDVFRERTPERVMESPVRKSPARKTSRNSRDER